MGDRDSVIRSRRWETVGAERKQLEAIAHLYLPERRERVEEQGARAGPGPSGVRDGCESLPFLVCLAVARYGIVPAVECLYNLGVLLRVSDGPVLLAGSEGAYRNRFSFGFRPDRERHVSSPGQPAPGGIRGPMDIRLIPAGPGEWAGGLHKAARTGSRPHGGLYHYVLTDDLPTAARLEDLPGMVLFLVTSRPDPEDFRGRDAEFLQRLCRCTGYAGVVTAGIREEHEGTELFRRWERVLTSCLPGTVRVEKTGDLPCPVSTRTSVIGVGIGMRVLEYPESPEARCLQAIASRIRKRRGDLFEGLPAEGLAPPHARV